MKPTWHTSMLLALAVLGTACGLDADLAFDLRFVSTSGELLDCRAAGAETIEIALQTAGDTGRPHDRVRLDCPLGDQVLEVDPGRYQLTARGFDERGTLCWEATENLVFDSDTAYHIDWALTPAAEGTANGCVYP